MTVMDSSMKTRISAVLDWNVLAANVHPGAMRLTPVPRGNSAMMDAASAYVQASSALQDGHAIQILGSAQMPAKGSNVQTANIA